MGVLKADFKGHLQKPVKLNNISHNNDKWWYTEKYGSSLEPLSYMPTFQHKALNFRCLEDVKMEQTGINVLGRFAWLDTESHPHPDPLKDIRIRRVFCRMLLGASVIIDIWKEILMKCFQDGEVYVVTNVFTRHYENRVKLFTSASIPMKVSSFPDNCQS